MALWWSLPVTLLLSITFVLSELTISDQSWQVWKQNHGKAYSSFDEEHFRYTIWNENLKRIFKHNQEGHRFTLAMNHLGDLTTKEVKLMLNGYRSGPAEHKVKGTNVKASTFLPPSNVKLPDKVDWRDKGYVTDVKNQAQCGSCWAFSTTGSLEGQHFKKTGKLVSLSEQNLVDCSRAYGNNGCEGGLMDYAFQYIKDNNGIDTETSYPYDAKDEKCKFNTSSVGATDTGFTDVKQDSEPDLKAAVATVGPISVAIDAGHLSFQFYHSGVYDEEACSSVSLDHGVLAVGYGTSDNGTDYWLVKNSWGTTWGMNGYIQMSRNKNNQCGIASKASYPLV